MPPPRGGGNLRNFPPEDSGRGPQIVLHRWYASRPEGGTAKINVVDGVKVSSHFAVLKISIEIEIEMHTVNAGT